MSIDIIENDLSTINTKNTLKNFTINKKTQSKNFFDHMSETLTNISTNQQNTENKIKNYQLNKSNNSLNDIMIDLQKSSIAIQLLVQIRNKLISSYQEIMNMQI